MSAKEFPWGKVRLALTADSSAFLIVLNIKVRMEATPSIPF